MEIPQLVTGPQKWDVFGPVGELINPYIPDDKADFGASAAASVAAFAAADGTDVAVPAFSHRRRVIARVGAV